MSAESGSIEDRPPLPSRRAGSSAAPRGLRALRGIVVREVGRSFRDTAELIGAVAWPTLWLVVFASGVQAVFGAVSMDAYWGAYKPYQEYVIPGLVGMVLLFGAMRIATVLVAGRVAGEARMVLVAPLPRPYLLFCRVVASAIVTTIQAYLFLIVATLAHFVMPAVDVPWDGWLLALPVIFLCGVMLASVAVVIALLLSRVREYSTTMRFVVYPVFLLSPALYPLWQFRENNAPYLYYVAAANPFSYVVELIRHAAYGGIHLPSLAVVAAVAIVGFAVAAFAFDPQRRLRGA